MKQNTRSIRIFIFILFVGAVAAAFWAGYQVSTLRAKEEPVELAEEPDVEKDDNEEQEDEETDSSMETATQQEHLLFVIKAYDGYLEVYLADGETLYMSTGITPESLDEEMQSQLADGIKIYSIDTLYEFLESYSS